MPVLPNLFIERLGKIFSAEIFPVVAASFEQEKPISVRVNRLKMKREDAVAQLVTLGASVESVDWYEDALIVNGLPRRRLSESELIQKGLIYQQSLSSMVVAVILGPQSNETVLDLCAAPGSKSTQIAALMENRGRVVCVDNIKKRFYRLKAVTHLLGATILDCKLMDGRRFRSPSMFDRILVDAPCSSEARFHVEDQKSFQFWSLRKIKEMQKKQKGLLLSAGRMLKPGGVMVYSTCSFAPEENEAVIDWFLRKSDDDWVIDRQVPSGIKTYPALTGWNGKNFDERVLNCVRILPKDGLEGFFVCRMIKRKMDKSGEV